VVDGVRLALPGCAAMHAKESIKVFLRTRPTTDVADDGGMSLDLDKGAVTLLGKRREDFGAVVHQREERRFRFSGGILHNASQDEVYLKVGSEMVTSVLRGYNATVMCYGQTGAGKTFTMTGARSSYAQRGLVPRALADLFKRVHQAPGTLMTCRVSYLEIYNELICDLLHPETKPSELAMSDDPAAGVVVKNLSSHLVSSEEDAMRLLFEGEHVRAVAEHRLNRQSSRSHTVFSVSLEIRDTTEHGTLTRSKLNLVDLAGSERLDKTKSSGSVAKEAQHINKSLSFLEQVIIALGDAQSKHVPYRSSKLTHVLKDSLGGNCKTALVANVWGETSHVEETTGTCKFAQRMMRVISEPNVNLVEDPAAKAVRLEKELAALTRRLQRATMPSSRVECDTSRDDTQNSQVNELAIDFMRRDAASESCDPLEAFLSTPEAARSALLAVRRVASRAIKEYETEDVRREGRVFSNASSPNRNVSEVGTLKGNFGEDELRSMTGIAPADSRPPRDIEAEASLCDSLEFNTESPSASFSVSPRSVSPVRGNAKHGHDKKGNPPPDRETAFVEYKKNGEGSATALALFENKLAKNELKIACKNLALSINECKKRLDAATARKELVAQSRPPMSSPDTHNNLTDTHLNDSHDTTQHVEIMTEEEYECAVAIKNSKREYRGLFETLKEKKNEVKYTERLIEQCTQTLVLEFESWYKAEYDVGVGGDEGGFRKSLFKGREDENEFMRNDTNPNLTYDSEASAEAYYSAQSASARGTKKGETPQQRRRAAQSAKPFAPRK
jgi:kinesin family protein 6/9